MDELCQGRDIGEKFTQANWYQSPERRTQTILKKQREGYGSTFSSGSRGAEAVTRE
jgi:hypothetical protein